MRTALFLLLLLSIAAVPGSIFPQRSIDPAASPTTWIADHTGAGPVLDRLGFFDVYTSPWFSAIYLLLFVSLIGCVVPRTQDPLAPGALGTAARPAPPRAARPRTGTGTSRATPPRCAIGCRAALRTPSLPRARPRRRDPARPRRATCARPATWSSTSRSSASSSVSRWGHLLGWKGDVIVPVGKTFANTLSRYDTFSPGPWVDVNALEPYTIKIDRLDATFETEVTTPGQFGAPRDFEAFTTFTDADGNSEPRSIRVNHPLETGGGSVFLLGNGYAPVVTVRDGDGTVLYSDATPFLPQDDNYTSVGAVKVPGASPQQLGFAGFFLPTGQIDDQGPHSIFPDALDPQLALTAFEGELFPSGRPQSVYSLDTEAMTAVPGKDGADQLRILLRPGETYELPDGRGLDHLRHGRAVRRPVHPHRPGQVAHPRRRAALAGRAGRLARHPPSTGVRAGWSGAGGGSYCGVRRRPGQGRRRRDARRARGPPERTRRNAMTDQTLAQFSNLAIYSAMVVLTLAMLADAVYLARLVPAREAAKETARERELVPAGAAADTEAADPASEGPVSATTGRDAEPLAARKAAAIGWTLTLLGTVFVVAGVVLRALEVHRWPLGNMYEFAIVGSMFVLLAYCGWSLRRDLRWLGLFVVIPVLLNLGLAITVWYTDAAELMPSLRSVWLAIHVAVATLSVAVFTIGFSLGVMYLVQDRLESATERPRSFMSRLPDARALERLTYAVHIVAFPLWTFTVIAGAIWARQAWGSYWNWDPKEVWSFVIWVVYAAYLHARATTGWKRQNAVWIALAGYGCIILNFAVVNVFFVGQHSYSGL